MSIYGGTTLRHCIISAEKTKLDNFGDKLVENEPNVLCVVTFRRQTKAKIRKEILVQDNFHNIRQKILRFTRNICQTILYHGLSFEESQFTCALTSPEISRDLCMQQGSRSRSYSTYSGERKRYSWREELCILEVPSSHLFPFIPLEKHFQLFARSPHKVCQLS